MKMKLLLASLIALSSLSVLAETSGTLNLRGSVAAINSIEITADGAASALDIYNGNSNLQVATVAETSNNALGYDITMSSQNGGKLVHTNNAEQFSNYAISYNGLAAVAPTGEAQVVKTVNSVSGLTTVTSDVKIDLAANTNAAAGEYTDIITFSIVAH